MPQLVLQRVCCDVKPLTVLCALVSGHLPLLPADAGNVVISGIESMHSFTGTAAAPVWCMCSGGESREQAEGAAAAGGATGISHERQPTGKQWPPSIIWLQTDAMMHEVVSIPQVAVGVHIHGSNSCCGYEQWIHQFSCVHGIVVVPI